jgi:hypothetical protein
LAKEDLDLKLIDVKQQSFYPYIYFDGHFMMIPTLMGPIAPKTPFEPIGIGPGSCCCLR